MTDENSWLDPLIGQSQLPSDNNRFNNRELVRKVQAQFWEMAKEDLEAQRRPKMKKLARDGQSDFLFSYINWALAQEQPRERRELLRRLQNNFSGLVNTNLQITEIQTLLYEIYLAEFPEQKRALLAVLVEINLPLAKIVDEQAHARGLKHLINVVKGQDHRLIGYEKKTGKLTLALENQTGQLLIEDQTGIVGTLPKLQPKKSRYPGEIFQPEVIAANIDKLVKSDFDISADLKKASEQNTLAAALGQLYSCIVFMIAGRDNTYLVSTIKEIQRALKPLRQKIRLKDDSLNVFGNLLIASIDRLPVNQREEMRRIICAGIRELKNHNEKIFGELAWEYFGLGSSGQIISAEPKPDIILKQPTTISQPAAVLENNEWQEVLQSLEPLDRLVAIWQSKRVNLNRVGKMDNYAREIINLILCGQRNPEEEVLRHGYKIWQKLVHPDKQTDSQLQEFGKRIFAIGTLTQRREFISEETQRNITELFELVASLMLTHSILVAPRAAKRLLVVQESDLAGIIKRAGIKYPLKAIIGGQVIDSADLPKTKISAGQVVEVIIAED